MRYAIRIRVALKGSQNEDLARAVACGKLIRHCNCFAQPARCTRWSSTAIADVLGRPCASITKDGLHRVWLWAPMQARHTQISSAVHVCQAIQQWKCLVLGPCIRRLAAGIALHRPQYGRQQYGKARVRDVDANYHSSQCAVRSERLLLPYCLCRPPNCEQYCD